MTKTLAGILRALTLSPIPLRARPVQTHTCTLSQNGAHSHAHFKTSWPLSGWGMRIRALLRSYTQSVYLGVCPHSKSCKDAIGISAQNTESSYRCSF